MALPSGGGMKQTHRHIAVLCHAATVFTHHTKGKRFIQDQAELVLFLELDLRTDTWTEIRQLFRITTITGRLPTTLAKSKTSPSFSNTPSVTMNFLFNGPP